MAEAQPLPQPQPRQVAEYLYKAADQIALFESLPVFNNDQMLRENTRSIALLQQAITALNATLQTNMNTLNTTIRTLRSDMTILNTGIETLRNDMTTGFARLNTNLEASNDNSRARLNNSRVTHRDQPLSMIKTTDNVEPPGFPVTSGQLSSMTAETLNPLLITYGLPRDGVIEVKRRRFRTFIGMADYT